MTKLFTLAVLTSLLAHSAFAAGPILFILERSTNRNQVVYEANITPEGFDQKQPIHPYWKMIEKAGKVEELNGIERSEAYGVNVTEVSLHEITFTLSAMPKLPIVLKLSTKKDSAPHAYMALNGSEVDLKRLFLNVEDGGLMPRLKFVDVSGNQRGHGVNYKLYVEKDEQIRVENAPHALSPHSSVYGQSRFGNTKL